MTGRRVENHVVITGAMGSGKTTVGRLVADRLDVPFVDSDAQLDDQVGLTAREITRRRGVDALHRLEADALRNALERTEPAVIAAAASTGDLVSIESLLGGDDFVVLLEGDVEVLSERAAKGSHRRSVPVDEARKLVAVRGPRLKKVTDLVVDVTSIEPGAVADRIVDAMSNASPE
jgi:shikimate kinase